MPRLRLFALGVAVVAGAAAFAGVHDALDFGVLAVGAAVVAAWSL